MLLKCADFNAKEFFKSVPLLKNPPGNPGGNKRHYMGITCAFDIETTYLRDIKESIMYIWQFQIGEDHTIIGRTWDEYLQFLKDIKEALPPERWLVIFVHNLSFEITFLKGIYPFTSEEVFALASRKVLKCDMFGVFEYRCSYKLTNMNLDQFTKKMKVKHRKLSGVEFDYNKIRYPWTDLTERELEYCVNDVRGLVEAVNALMARDGDNLSTIPLTSTGYVRREAKKAMRSGERHHNFIYNMLPDYDLYCALRSAFRGGNTHCSRFISSTIDSPCTVFNVHSSDRSSSYPAVLCNRPYPTTFYKIAPSDLNGDYIDRCVNVRNKALLLRVKLINVELKNPYWGCPYLTTDKCDNIEHTILETAPGKRGKMKNFYHVDNGRIIKCGALETTVTDVDMKIICHEYKFTDCIYLYGWYASYEKLPEELINLIIDYYRKKTELKGVKGQEVFYDKAKSLLNSLYGMMAQDPVKHNILYQREKEFSYENAWVDEAPKDKKALEKYESEKLGKYNSSAFVCYQWGVWCTAWARFELELGLDMVEEARQKALADPNFSGEIPLFCYCDTDSIKYTGFVDWTEYNKQKIEECKISGAFATDPSGVTHYMGVFESEDGNKDGYSYYMFRSMGAKKYAYVIDKVEMWEEEIKLGDTVYKYRKVGKGRTHCTISGVNKALGGKELDKYKGLESFIDDFTFVDAGGLESVYSDCPSIKEVEIDGHILKITSNVSILPSTYTLGITSEYERIIKYSRSYLENPFYI